LKRDKKNVKPANYTEVHPLDRRRKWKGDSHQRIIFAKVSFKRGIAFLR